jgi:hypothetical protein
MGGEMKKINFIIGSIFIIFSIIIFILANNFSQNLVVDVGLKADFFPKLISILMIIASCVLIHGSLKNKSLSNHISDVFNSDMKKPLLGMALIISYGISMIVIGYLVSTVVFCFIFLHIFKVKKLLTKCIVSIVFSLIIYFIFNNLFLINLPRGILI